MAAVCSTTSAGLPATSITTPLEPSATGSFRPADHVVTKPAGRRIPHLGGGHTHGPCSFATKLPSDAVLAASPASSHLSTVWSTTNVLSPSEQHWRRVNNEWFESTLTNPFTTEPALADRSIHPHTSSWFHIEASRFIDRTAGYLAILDTHAVPWTELRSPAPGPVLFADDDQLVVAGIHDPGSLGPHIVEWGRRRRVGDAQS